VLYTDNVQIANLVDEGDSGEGLVRVVEVHQLNGLINVLHRPVESAKESCDFVEDLIAYLWHLS